MILADWREGFGDATMAWIHIPFWRRCYASGPSSWVTELGLAAAMVPTGGCSSVFGSIDCELLADGFQPGDDELEEEEAEERCWA